MSEKGLKGGLDERKKGGRKERAGERKWNGIEYDNNGSNTRREDEGCENEGLGRWFWGMGWGDEMNGERFVCLRGRAGRIGILW